MVMILGLLREGMVVPVTLERSRATVGAASSSRPRACKSQKKKGVAAHGDALARKCRAMQGESAKIAQAAPFSSSGDGRDLNLAE
jgi:hypothetical protein